MSYAFVKFTVSALERKEIREKCVFDSELMIVRSSHKTWEAAPKPKLDELIDGLVDVTDNDSGLPSSLENPGLFL